MAKQRGSQHRGEGEQEGEVRRDELGQEGVPLPDGEQYSQPEVWKDMRRFSVKGFF